jgi:hypothetical protein
MKATVHPVDGVPGPHDNSWVDAVLTALRAEAIPAGALVARPLGIGPGAVLAFWTDDAPTAGFVAGPVTVGPGTAYEIGPHQAGTSTGPARYLQLTTFTGRGDDWCAAFDRSGRERIWPAVKDVPGLVGSLVGSAPGGGRLAITLADSAESLEAGAAAITSSALLPWEDPAHLTGPDALAVLRLVHADVPAGATR